MYRFWYINQKAVSAFYRQSHNDFAKVKDMGYKKISICDITRLASTGRLFLAIPFSESLEEKRKIEETFDKTFQKWSFGPLLFWKASRKSVFHYEGKLFRPQSCLYLDASNRNMEMIARLDITNYSDYKIALTGQAEIVRFCIGLRGGVDVVSTNECSLDSAFPGEELYIDLDVPFDKVARRFYFIREKPKNGCWFRVKDLVYFPHTIRAGIYAYDHKYTEVERNSLIQLCDVLHGWGESGDYWTIPYEKISSPDSGSVVLKLTQMEQPGLG
jgi:hypothetical protein